MVTQNDDQSRSICTASKCVSFRAGRDGKFASRFIKTVDYCKVHRVHSCNTLSSSSWPFGRTIIMMLLLFKMAYGRWTMHDARCPMEMLDLGCEVQWVVDEEALNKYKYLYYFLWPGCLAFAAPPLGWMNQSRTEIKNNNLRLFSCSCVVQVPVTAGGGGTRITSVFL